MFSRPATSTWRISYYRTWKAADVLRVHAAYFSINNRLICYFSSEQKNRPWNLSLTIHCALLFKCDMQLDMHNALMCFRSHTFCTVNVWKIFFDQIFLFFFLQGARHRLLFLINLFHISMLVLCLFWLNWFPAHEGCFLFMRSPSETSWPTFC